MFEEEKLHKLIEGSFAILSVRYAKVQYDLIPRRKKIAKLDFRYKVS